VKFGTRRDGVVPRLETSDGGDNDVKGNGPGSGVFLGRWGRKIVSGSELEYFSDPQATIDDNIVVQLLVGVQVFHVSLSLGIRCEFGKSTEHLTTSETTDVNVVTKNGGISGGNGERNFGESWVKGFNVDNSVLLIPETEGTKQTVDFQFRIGRPDTNVVTMLVSNARSLSVEFNVNAVAVNSVLEKLASDSNGSRVRVLGIVDTLCPSKGTSRQFT